MSEISTNTPRTTPAFEQMPPAAQHLLFEIEALIYCTKKTIPKDGPMKGERVAKVRVTIEVIQKKYNEFFNLIGS